jgi:prevent-host-death family protein
MGWLGGPEIAKFQSFSLILPVSFSRVKLKLKLNLRLRAVKSITLVEFRKNMEGTLERVARGQSVVLTRRGRAVAQLEPLRKRALAADDPFYHLYELAVEGEAASNEQMDREVYGI